MDELALTDTLKLIFNISKIYSNLAEAFLPAIPDILTITSRADIPSKPLDGIIGYLVNCLSILDIESENVKHLESSLFQNSNQNMNIDRLINLLDRSVSVYSSSELEIKAVPLIYGLIIIYETAPEDSRKCMKQLLLPEADDRSQPIGHSDDLPSRLLKTMNTPYQNLKTAISELMFVLSERDSENLTKNIGYGFAAGFLASRGMEVPKVAGEEDSGGLDPAINPITGQRWSAEPSDPGPPMTKEEKEREAERLFVLFERYVDHAKPAIRTMLTLNTEQGPLEFSTWRILSDRQLSLEDWKNCLIPTKIAIRMSIIPVLFCSLGHLVIILL